MKRATHIVSVGTALLVTACASRGPRSPEYDPAALAALHAERRLVGAETTWVTSGAGYELVGRSKGDLVLFQPQLDREAAMFHRVFPNDSLTPVVATVRRMTAPGKPFIPAAPVPTPVRGTIVELVVPDPKAAKEDDKSRSLSANAIGLGRSAEWNPVLPVVRAWLSARASALTGTPARPVQAHGEVEDPRVPAWAEEMIPSLVADSLVDRITTTLALHSESLIPLARYFTMEQPSSIDTPMGQRGGGEGRGAGGGGGGGGGRGGTGGVGGIGGRGGMGGRGGGGGGRGGMGGRGGTGGGDRSRGDQQTPPLEPAALFDAESVVFGRYLSREGYDLIGALADAQILGKSIDDVLAKRNAATVAQMDVEFRRWLLDRAVVVTPR